MEIHLRGDAVTPVATLHLPDGAAYDFQLSASTSLFEKRVDGVPNSRYELERISPPLADWRLLTKSESLWRVTDAQEKRVWTFKTFVPINYRPTTPSDPNPHARALPTKMEAQGYVWNFNYDANGVLQSIVDSFGRTFTFTWNYFAYAAPPQGCAQRPSDPVSIKEIALPGGGKLRYTYDPIRGPGGVPTVMVRRLITAEQVDSSGTLVDQTTYHYDDTPLPPAQQGQPRALDSLTGITDARGVRYATFAYDAIGRTVSSENAGAQNRYTVDYSRVDYTLTRTVTNPLGKVTKYNFEHPGNAHKIRLSNVDGVASASCPASASSYTYSANGWVASETDEEGRVTAYVRDANNRPTSITRGSGTANAVTTTLTWNSPYDIPTQTVEPGLTTNVTVGATGLITQIQKVDTTTQTVPYSTNGQTRTTTYGYNATGQLTSVNGPLVGAGDTVTYAYVASGANRGNLQTITNEMGRVTMVTAWNARGQPTSVTDPNGVVTTLGYEPARGLLTQVSVDTAGTPATTTIQYDAIGQITKITLPNGAFESYTYDNARRLTKVTNSAGETIDYVRNANGDVTGTTIKRATLTTYSRTRTFDELGRLIQSIGAGSQTYKYAYDRSDNLVKTADPRYAINDPTNRVFQYGFDSLNRLISETDEENRTVNLTRNGTDDVTLYTDARTLTTPYIRNGFGEVIREVSPDRGTTTYWRDARGLIAIRTDGRGIRTDFTYDNSGRLTGKTYLNQPAFFQTFSWDQTASGNYGIGRLVTAASETGQNLRVFDQKGRVYLDHRTPTSAPALTTQYGYDAAGNVTSMVYPSGRQVTITRDAFARVSGVSTRQNGAAPLQTVVSGALWHPYGPLQRIDFGYGNRALNTVDADYRITRLRVGTVADPGALIDRTVLWTGDTVDRVNDLKSASLHQIFTYTPTRRLLTASSTGSYGALSWTYDANGNRASETANGVSSTYAYPLGSNRLTSVTGGGNTRSLTYDAAGNILTDSRTGALGIAFTYDVEGRLRTATPSGGSAATYGYDAFDRLASRAVNGVATLYVHDLADHIIAETDGAGVTRREYIWLNDLPIAVVDGVNTASPTLYYVHTDHLGRPIEAMSQGGATVWEALYAPFGAVHSVFNAVGFGGIDLRFPGQWFQLESGLAYNWHRHYDASLGRYVQPDPIGYEGGRSLYGYVGQNPLVNVDPFGLCPTHAPDCIEPVYPDLWAIGAASGATWTARAFRWCLLYFSNRNNFDVPPEVGVGPYANGSIPAGPSPVPTKSQQDAINQLGNQYGCHTCGTTNPGTKSGNWIGDHQPPTGLNPAGNSQSYFPHCSACSARQGGLLRWLK